MDGIQDGGFQDDVLNMLQNVKCPFRQQQDIINNLKLGTKKRYFKN